MKAKQYIKQLTEQRDTVSHRYATQCDTIDEVIRELSFTQDTLATSQGRIELDSGGLWYYLQGIITKLQQISE